MRANLLNICLNGKVWMFLPASSSHLLQPVVSTEGSEQFGFSDAEQGVGDLTVPSVSVWTTPQSSQNDHRTLLRSNVL